MRIVACCLVAVLASAPCPAAEPHGEPPVAAPFEGVDTLATNDWWNRSPSKIHKLDVPRDQVVAFGLYTVADGVLKLSAQLYPLYPEETRTVRLEFRRDGEWQEAARQDVNDIGWSTTFRVEGWDAAQEIPYRLRHGDDAAFAGTIRRDPGDKREVVLAALSCNSSKDRGGRARMVANLLHQDPDLLFFAGDQSYDHREHTAAWLAWGRQFRDVLRDRPCITIPDDHDVGQPNLWGESGKQAKLSGAADGGYLLDADYVKMVERQQTAHLPDPVDPAPVGQGIGVYFTRLKLGGVDFAIIEDRKFKSGPAGKIPQQGPRPDHIRNPEYDPQSINLPGLELLGERQLAFLDRWADDRQGVAMKAVLSQTGFCGAAHIHGREDNRLHADLDSNGWPQDGRDAALRLIRRAGAVHIGGDQHLGTVVQHGIDDFGDGPWAFVVPAIVNNYYSRWWSPEGGAAGANHDPQNPLPWTGDYRDGFDNRITMHAYANPDSESFGGGYGLVRFDKQGQTITFECWPRGADATAADAKQFTGWPITVRAGSPEPVR